MSAKTHKGLAKRFKRTATGRVLRRSSGKRHLMSHKTADRVRRLSRWHELTKGDRASLERQFGHIRD
jgi:large subunit ribosomal protein L35